MTLISLIPMRLISYSVIVFLYVFLFLFLFRFNWNFGIFILFLRIVQKDFNSFHLGINQLQNSFDNLSFFMANWSIYHTIILMKFYHCSKSNKHLGKTHDYYSFHYLCNDNKYDWDWLVFMKILFMDLRFCFLESGSFLY